VYCIFFFLHVYPSLISASFVVNLQAAGRTVAGGIMAAVLGLVALLA
jgi:hypothetical protein